jgi:acetyl esterase/lipase
MNSSVSAANTRWRVERDVCYGHGAVGHCTSNPSTRPLLMDVYLPAGESPAEGRPSIVFSHGGAYHRGAKDHDEFEQGGSHNTPVHEYCERFAARGFVCFSIGYRLTQELPPPLDQPIKRQQHSVERARTDFVRGLLGLPLATVEELVRGIEAAYTDVANAFGFIQSHASRWGITPRRMAIGGFSAGAFASAYTAYALGHPAAAVICLSGGMDVPDAEYYLPRTSRKPPLLLFVGEHDLPSIPPRVASLASQAVSAGVGLRCYTVPGKPHFYDRASAVVLQQSTLAGGEHCTTVEQAMEKFLQDALA